MAFLFVFLFIVVIVIIIYLFRFLNITKNVKTKLSFPVFTEDDTNYRLMAQNANRICTVYPKRILQPRNTKDVSYIVRNYDNFAIRSCGNCCEPWSTCRETLIDMSLFTNAMMIYPDAPGKETIVMVETGLTYDNVYNYLHKEGYTLPGSFETHRGVVVQALTGGYGYLSRRYGSLVDNVVGVKIVLADGSDIVCSDTEHKDLFQALKGYGAGNFGVITQIFLRPIPFPRRATVFVYTYQNAGPVIEWFTSKNRRDLSNGISLKLFITKNEIRLHGLFLGGRRKLRLGGLPEPKERHSEELTYLEAFDKLKTKKIFESIKGKSHFGKKKLTPEAIAILTAYLRDIDANFIVEFQMLGGKIKDRNELYLLSYFITFDKRTPMINWALIQIDALYNKIYKYLTPFSSMTVMDRDVEDYLTAYYGDKLNRNRLLMTKWKYDPGNKFRYEQSIM